MQINNRIVPRWFAFLIVTFLLGVGFTASAQTTNSWDVDGGGLWSAPGNWNPTAAPDAVGSMAILTKTITATRIITNDAAITLGKLQVGSADGLANFIITNDSGTLTFDNGGAGAQFIASGANNLDRIYTPIVLGDYLTVTNVKTVQISSTISETGGAKSITKVGAGTLTLSGAGSSFSGGLIIKEGMVSAASGGLSRAGTGMITLGDTSGVNAASLIGNATYTNAVTVVAGSTGVKTIRNSGSSAALGVSGPVTLNDNVTLNAGNSTASTTISGVIDGPGAIISTGSSTVGIFVSLTAANSFSGGLTLQSGTLRVGNAAAFGTGLLTLGGGTLASASATAYTLTNAVVVTNNFTLGEAATGTGVLTLSGNMNLGSATRTITVNNAGSDILSGVISGDPGVGIIKAGTGAVSVNGANTYSGGVIINAGTWGCGNAGSLGTGSVTLGAVSGTNAASLTTGTSVITNDITVAAGGTGVRTMRNNGNSAATFSSPILLNTNLTVTTAGTGSTTLSGNISGGGGLTAASIAGSPNGVTLGGSNTFAGGVLLSAGILRVGDSNALGTGTLTISGGTTFCSDSNSRRNLNNPVVVNGDFTVGRGAGLGAGTIAFYGSMDLGSVARTITFTNTVTDNIYGTITGSGRLIKAGGVTLNLYGTNTFSGGLTVKEANIYFDNGNAVGTGLVTLGDSISTSNVTLYGQGLVTNDIVIVAGAAGTRTLRAALNDSTVEYSGGITLNTNLTVTCLVTNTTAILSGTVSGVGGLTVTAALPTNHIVLVGANTYAGDTTVSSGTLVVSNATGSATGSGNVTVKAGATLGVLGNISGNVTVESLGILGGKGGTIGGAVVVTNGAYLVPGNALNDIGALTINNTLTLDAGSTTLMEIDKANGINDAIQGLTTVNYNGTLTVTNLGGTNVLGDTYQLFSATGHTGDFAITNLPALASSLRWVWNPAAGTISVVAGTATTPTNISFTVSGNNLTLTWPESHLGWYAQSNAVTVADTNYWFDIADSQTATNLSITMNPALTNVFYRLRLP